MRRLALVLVVLALGGCRERPHDFALIGNPERGRTLVRAYGCPACHVVPGVRERGLVGPPLTEIGVRRYIAGHVPNVPQNLVRWIEAPERIEPRTAMPNLGVTERDARDIAAYLYTIR